MELTFYDDGTAILTDAAGELVWASDADEEWLETADEQFLTLAEDKDDVLEFLEDAGYIDPGEKVEVTQEDDDEESDDVDVDVDVDDEDEDDDEEEDEPGDAW